MAGNSDGSLVFDAKIDTSGINSDLKDLYGKLNDTTDAIEQQKSVVEELEKGYNELNSALDEARRNEDPKAIRAYSNGLKEVGAELEQARDKLASFQALQYEIKQEMRSTGSDFSSQVQTISNGVVKLQKLVTQTFMKFVGWQLLYKGFEHIKDAIAETMPEFQELQASLKNLEIAFVNVAVPIVQLFTPILINLVNVLTKVANTIYEIIASLAGVFGGDLPERIESIPENLKKSGKQAKKAAKNFASFDEIMQIGQNSIADEADTAVVAMAKANNAAKETEKTTESIKDKLINFLKELGTISLAGLFLPKTASFLGLLNGLGDSYSSYKDMYDNGITWSNLTDSILSFAKTIASAIAILDKIGWMKDSKGALTLSFILIASAICDLYTTFKDIFENGITWPNIANGVVEFAKLIAAAAIAITVAKTVKKGSGIWNICIGLASTAAFLLIAAGMCGLYFAFKDAFENGINWENLTLGLISFAGIVAGAIILIKIAKLKKGTVNNIGKSGETSGSGQSSTSAWKILGAGLAIVAPFLLIAAGMCAIYLAFPDAFDNGINWSNICQGLGKFAAGVAIALALGLAGTIVMKKTGNSIWSLLAAGLAVAVPFLLIAAGMCAVYSAFTDAFENGINWSNICQGLGKFTAIVGTAIGIGTVGKLKLGGQGIFSKLAGGLAVAAPFLLIAAGMCAVYSAFTDAFENGINWSNICQGLGKFTAIVGTAIGIGTLVVTFTGGAGLIAILVGGLAVAAPFLLIAVGMCMVWNNYSAAFSQGIQWDNLTLGLKDFATDLADALAIKSQVKLGTLTGGLIGFLTGGVSKMAPFLLIAAAIGELYKEYKDVFENGVQWNNLVNGLDDFCDKVKNAFEKLDTNVTNWWKNSAVKSVIDQMTSFFKDNSSNFSALQTVLVPNEQNAIFDAAQNVSASSFRYSAPVTGNLPGISRVISSGGTVNTRDTSDAFDLDTLTTAFVGALQRSGFGNAVMQVDGITFGRLVYDYSSSESTRRGVNLLLKE